ncbi:hypothetical protein [Lactobacillus acetotolerans]|uniref:hypothetical protein n=1 Tax=Lactobacillus acetotolerans TaxID=1600 RepID=UPI002FD8BB84
MKDEVLTRPGNIVKEWKFTAVNWGDTGIGLMDTDGPEDKEPHVFIISQENVKPFYEWLGRQLEVEK